jgi:hypothetical protein
LFLKKESGRLQMVYATAGWPEFFALGVAMGQLSGHFSHPVVCCPLFFGKILFEREASDGRC